MIRTKFDPNETDVSVTLLHHFLILKPLRTSQQPFIAMASKRRLTSTDDIELRVVVKFCVELKLQPVEALKQIQNAPADRTHDTELDIDLLALRERLRTHIVLTKDQCFYLNYHS